MRAHRDPRGASRRAREGRCAALELAPGRREHARQLARLGELLDDVAAADELAVDEELRDRRPVRPAGEDLADARVDEDVDGDVGRAGVLEALHDAGGEAAAGASGVPFMNRATLFGRRSRWICSRICSSVTTDMWATPAPGTAVLIESAWMAPEPSSCSTAL